MTPRGYSAGTVTITENLLKRKWSIVILRHLSNGLTDAASIFKAETELPTAAMNERLRTMQRYGLIVRHPRRASVKAIEYRLTDRGHKILRLLTLIEQLDELPTLNDIVLKRTRTDTPAAVRAPRPSALQKRTRQVTRPAGESAAQLPLVAK
jgi:DNA-binding HxlR family transcriptional regulator